VNVNVYLLGKCAGLPLTYSAQKINSANVAAFAPLYSTFLEISELNNMKNDELTFKQTKACYLIVSGMSMRDVADSVGTSETTIFRWLKLPAFQDELRQLKRIVIERSLGKLQVLNDKSIQTLERLLNCGNYPTECRAAVAILTKNHESIDFFEYESRLKVIESKFNEEK
jgi:hypothetical protein